MYWGTVEEPWETRKALMPSWFRHSRMAVGIYRRSFTSLPLLAPCMVP